MGGIGEAVGGVLGLGGGEKAARRGANAEVEAQLKAIEEQRRQFDATREMLQPFVDAGSGQLGALGDSATLGGLASNLDAIMNSSELDPLREQRLGAINTAFGSSGMLNSGSRASAIANDLTDFSLGIEGLLNNRQAGLASMGAGAAGGLAGIGQQSANAISGLQQGIGQSQAAGIIGAQQARSNLAQQGLGILGTAGQALLTFSDSRLKENIREIGAIGPLSVYEWDWVPELEAVGIKLAMNAGFMADEVEQLFPEHVHQFGRFQVVDYPRVLDRLEEVLH